MEKLSDVFPVEWARETLRNPDSVIALSDVAIVVLHENGVSENEIMDLYGESVFGGLSRHLVAESK